MAAERKPSNPFLDDDDDEVDDFEFLNHPRQGQSGYLLRNETQQLSNDYETQRMQLLEERRRIEERTLQSTNNSVGLIYESEQVGILTAEELVKQREQLEHIEENLDVINSTMRTSQKHINSIKSMFGGIKNYFSKSGASDPSARSAGEVSPVKRAPRELEETVGNLKADTKLNESTHPALRIRDMPYDGLDSTVEPEVAKDRARPPPVSAGYITADERLDKNLECMSLGLGRLKDLAIGLNAEMSLQNEMLDTIHNKTDRAEDTIQHQNRQIKRILKK